jgi:hypothetical protein
VAGVWFPWPMVRMQGENGERAMTTTTGTTSTTERREARDAAASFAGRVAGRRVARGDARPTIRRRTRA